MDTKANQDDSIQPAEMPFLKQTEQLKKNLNMILSEQLQLAAKLDYGQIAKLIPELMTAERIFVAGAGRSGLSMKAAAMRLMHFGFQVYVAGETTTPAIRKGDLLLAASGSGTTTSIVNAAQKAVNAGAKVVALSVTADSPLAALAELVCILPAAQKQDHGKTMSQQYAGSLYEQGLLLLTDAIFQTLWAMEYSPAETLWTRHANLE
ncbi:6-phospho-3-hexuloisomerase [Pedobacter antarcticus]|uniref:6-phospho-3-hexuloisomerase n=1 Tax=Pedobacter antarcticus TaxID=34086 RepID=UPI00088AF49B|nr:6-phospho-3-hexuloisomerase [Pedobacter antarcticus]SDM64459.1 3-hexulose-6-phosphate isomerase [Pedobacter antarcticus]